MLFYLIGNSYQIKTLRKKRKGIQGRNEKKENHLLDGLLYCGDCKHRITIRYQTKTGRSYTTCDYYRTYSKYHVCTTHTNNYEALERVILDNIIGVLHEKDFYYLYYMFFHYYNLL